MTISIDEPPCEVIENAWFDAEARGTDAIRHERIIHLAGWVACGAVLLRTLRY